MYTSNWTRKAAKWSEVYTTVSPAALPTEPPLTCYTAKSLGIERDPLGNFVVKPEQQYFLVVRRDNSMYLVNTEGYDYARYITKVVSTPDATITLGSRP